MNTKVKVALCATVLGIAAAPAPALGATAGVPVSVRVEGQKRALLAPTVVRLHPGSVTQGGAKPGQCSSLSAAGALDAATHHRWGGKFEASFGDYFVTSILGELQSGTRNYWALWVDNRFASAGACGTKLRRGDDVLFAVDSAKHHEHPLGIVAPGSATVGRRFAVTVVAYSDAGKASPLRGATVSVNGHNGKTNRFGQVPLTATHAGTFTLQASDAGYITAAPVSVHVRG